MTSINTQSSRPVTPAAGNDNAAPAGGTQGSTAAGGVAGFQPTAPTQATNASSANASAGGAAKPSLPAVRTEVFGNDLQVAMQDVQDKFKQSKTKSAETQVEQAKGLAQQAATQRINALDYAAKNLDIDVLGGLLNYAMKNPGQLINLALTIVPALVAAPATGGASLVAALPTVAGMAVPMVNGVLAEMGINLNQLVAGLTESVLVSLGVEPIQARRIAELGTSVLFLGIDIGASIVSGGKTLPSAASFALVAENIANLTGMSIADAQSISRAVAGIAGTALAIGGGIATLGASYGGLDQIFAKGGDLLGLVSNAAQGNVDLAAITKAWTDLQPLLDVLLKQINQDTGGLDKLWGDIADAWNRSAKFVEEQTQPTITPQSTTYA